MFTVSHRAAVTHKGRRPDGHPTTKPRGEVLARYYRGKDISMTRTVTDLDGLIAVDPKRAAEMTGLSRGTIYNLIERGVLRRSKIGRATRIPVADLIALIEDGIA